MRKNVFRVLQSLCLGSLLLPSVALAEGPGAAAQAEGGGVYSAAGTAEPAGDVVAVSTPAELASAIASASAGTTIVLADGEYDQSAAFSISGKKGTETAPITIRAEHQGQAVFTGKAGLNVSNSSYIVIQGIKFTGSGTAVTLNNSNHVRVTRNTFALKAIFNPSGFKWSQFQGSNSHHNRIDHNEFGPRGDLGQMIAFQGSVMSQYDVIEYNYFHDAAPQTENGGETIRVGLSGSSMSNGYTTIQYNLFVNCDSDAEVISVKSGNNTVRYNTFIDNKGQVTARHGHANSYYGNYFFRTGDKAGVGGLRIYANDQKIYNNYFENISGTIHIDGGDYDAGPDGKNYTSDVLTKHWRVYRAQVVHNTIVNSSSGIVVGKSYTYAPVDSIVADNLVVGSGGPLYSEVKTSNTVFSGNIGYGGTLDNVTRSTYEIREADPRFVTVDGLQKLSAASPAIDAGVGTYPFVTDDMDGQPRAASDVGADEFSAAPGFRRPLTAADVGPNAVTRVSAQVSGQAVGGWYNGDVTVTLSPVNTEPGIGRTEYRLDAGTECRVYSSPILVSGEGRHTLAFRHTNGDGRVEPEQAVQVNIDTTPPAYRLLANGQPLTAASIFDDTETLNLQLQAEDALSGLKGQSFTVFGATYGTQGSIPLTGKIGLQSAKVKAEDAAGNVREETVTFRVAPTLATLLDMTRGYIDSGDMTGPLVPRLTELLRQAEHQAGKDSVQQAVKFLSNALKHLQNPPRELDITPAAKQALQTYTEALIAWWSR
ncbi:polysaccharide lyase 6 family protein [Paenibacillus sp. P26]|nr:polysaccharide lyase 6 family protein [Paenibacillus sp. P26]